MFGWQRKSDILCPVYFEGVSASEYLNSLVCTCKAPNCNAECSCCKGKIACIPFLCKCKGDCLNPYEDGEDESNVTES